MSTEARGDHAGRGRADRVGDAPDGATPGQSAGPASAPAAAPAPAATLTPGPGPDSRLGYLLKHAQMRLAELNAAALAPYGISGRELAVLLVLADGEPTSQRQAAERLGIDRTTMVAFLDTLETRDMVARRPSPADRRRNEVALTPTGRTTLRAATAASDAAERAFLAPLAAEEAATLRAALRAVVLPGR